METIFDKMSPWYFVFLFVIVSLPGLVSMHISRLLFPCQDIDWKTAFQESIFWGSLNLAIMGTFFCYVLTIFTDVSVSYKWVLAALGIPSFIPYPF